MSRKLKRSFDRDSIEANQKENRLMNCATFAGMSKNESKIVVCARDEC